MPFIDKFVCVLPRHSWQFVDYIKLLYILIKNYIKNSSGDQREKKIV